MISISVVSHLQSHLVKELLGDLDRCCKGYPLEVLVTLNLPEAITFSVNDFSFPLTIYKNSAPKGFSANHNQAFRRAVGKLFCVINPDIRFGSNPFLPLASCLTNAHIGVVAPIVLNAQGTLEDSARHFPTPFKILCKAFGNCLGSDYHVKDAPIYPDWVGGMFMLFRHSVFQQMGGFNDRYFLYYEDVDLCARLRLQGYEVMLSPQAQVVHHAQRSSHRNFKYLRWHLTSMLRFFLSSAFLKWQYRKLTRHNKD